jgi:tetratricopeptide (TPR) repeat protein/tRNA A-37 threonylcarbamoyl transferase component Bud32
METERWHTVDRLCHIALEIEESQRAAYLEKACGGDESLKQAVESVLAYAAKDTFLAGTAMELAAKALAAESEPACPSPGSVIGRYRVMRLLGEGGMGAVYEAEQDQPRRIVALKLIKPSFATALNLRRFQHESQALGRLQHPGIAQIHEASTADNGFGLQPYFAMELIRGRALLESARTRQLNTRERLELMAKICDAVEHAHQRGVIHRDLKPGNILVDETGQPKILDFGVARVTDRDVQPTRQTDLGQLVGTLAYMSPEQALGDPMVIDTRSDVYTLGLILYELLAGKLPYQIDQVPLPEAVRVIREHEPAPLSSFDRGYRGDIDTIVAKALEKDKGRRYGSSAELAADIRRYLTDEPIMARPASARYQLQKFARRHKPLVAAAAAVFVALAAGVVASTWEAVRARTAQQVAVTQRDRAVAAERRATAQEESARRSAAIAEQERKTAISEKVRADAEATTAEAVNDFLRNDLLSQASPARQPGPSAKPDPDIKVRTALDRAAARIDGKFDARPEVEAAIRDTIGQTYLDLAMFKEGENQARRALELRRRVLGVANPETLKSMDHVARATNNGPEAESLFSQTLGIRRRMLGPEHPDTLTSMDGLAEAYHFEEKYAQAEALFRRVLEIRKRVLGPEHPDTLKTMIGLAREYESERKYAQSESLYVEMLGIGRRILGPEHPNVLAGMMGLANVYLGQGRFPQAEALYAQVVAYQSRVLGPEHWETLKSENNLAETYLREGKSSEAEKVLKETVEIARRVYGPWNGGIVIFMNNLAAAYDEQDKLPQAESTLSEFLEPLRKHAGDEDSFTLNTLSNLAFICVREGKYAQAETYAKEDLAGRRHASSPEDPGTIGAAANLATAYQSQGKFAESEPLAREAVEFYRKKLPDDWQRSRMESLLGATLVGQKKFTEGEPLLLDGYRGMKARKERFTVPEQYYLDRAREWIVRLYDEWGKPDKAAEWKSK